MTAIISSYLTDDQQPRTFVTAHTVDPDKAHLSIGIGRDEFGVLGTYIELATMLATLSDQLEECRQENDKAEAEPVRNPPAPDTDWRPREPDPLRRYVVPVGGATFDAGQAS